MTIFESVRESAKRDTHPQIFGNPYEKLSTAIIKQAVKDYRVLARRLHRLEKMYAKCCTHKTDYDYKHGLKTEINLNTRELNKIERFFKSQWCEELHLLEYDFGSECLKRLIEECHTEDLKR